MNIIRDNTFYWKNRFVSVYTFLASDKDDNDEIVYTVCAAMKHIQLFSIKSSDLALSQEIFNQLDNMMSFQKASIMMTLFQRIKGTKNPKEALLELFSYKQGNFKYRIWELEEYGFYINETKNFKGEDIAIGYSTLTVAYGEDQEPIGEFQGRNNGKNSFTFHFYSV